MRLISTASRSHGQLLCACAYTIFAGCAMVAPVHRDDEALRIATMSARYEFDCENASAEQISRNMVVPNWTPPYDEYKFGVRGCGKSDVVAITCGVDRDSGCNLQDAERLKTKEVGK